MRWLVLVALAACVDTPALHEPTVDSSHVSIIELPASSVPKLDVLVVMDDTTAMTAHAGRLATLRRMVAVRLDELSRSWFDLQIAVTSNDGTFHRLAGSPVPYLVDAFAFDYSHRTNYAGTLDDAVATLLDVGAANEQPSQPLEAMLRALQDNAQFVRDDAALSVLVVSASDDASPLPVSEYAAWTRGLRGIDEGWSGKQVTVVGIHAQPSPRLDEYYRSIQPHTAIVTPIDSGDFERATSALGTVVRSLGGLPCLEIDDLDATAPEFQHDCAMSAFVNDQLRSIPECPASSPILAVGDPAWSTTPDAACWQIASDPAYCGGFSTHKLVLRGYRSWIHPAFRFECRTR